MLNINLTQNIQVTQLQCKINTRLC